MKGFVVGLVALAGLAYVSAIPCGSGCGGGPPPPPCGCGGGSSGGSSSSSSSSSSSGYRFFDYEYQESTSVDQILSGWYNSWNSQYTQIIQQLQSVQIDQSSSIYNDYNTYLTNIQSQYDQINSLYQAELAKVSSLGLTVGSPDYISQLQNYLNTLQTNWNTFPTFYNLLQPTNYQQFVQGSSSSVSTKSVQETQVSSSSSGVGGAPAGPGPVGPGGNGVITLFQEQIKVSDVLSKGTGYWDYFFRQKYAKLQDWVGILQGLNVPSSYSGYSQYQEISTAVVTAYQKFGDKWQLFLKEVETNWSSWSQLDEAQLCSNLNQLINKYQNDLMPYWQVFGQYYGQLEQYIGQWQSACSSSGGAVAGASSGSYSKSESRSMQASASEYVEESSSFCG